MPVPRAIASDVGSGIILSNPLNGLDATQAYLCFTSRALKVTFSSWITKTSLIHTGRFSLLLCQGHHRCIASERFRELRLGGKIGTCPVSGLLPWRLRRTDIGFVQRRDPSNILRSYGRDQATPMLLVVLLHDSYGLPFLKAELRFSLYWYTFLDHSVLGI